jgi:hypothetical protein
MATNCLPVVLVNIKKNPKFVITPVNTENININAGVILSKSKNTTI